MPGIYYRIGVATTGRYFSIGSPVTGIYYRTGSPVTGRYYAVGAGSGGMYFRIGSARTGVYYRIGVGLTGRYFRIKPLPGRYFRIRGEVGPGLLTITCGTTTVLHWTADEDFDGTPLLVLSPQGAGASLTAGLASQDDDDPTHWSWVLTPSRDQVATVSINDTTTGAGILSQPVLIGCRTGKWHIKLLRHTCHCQRGLSRLDRLDVQFALAISAFEAGDYPTSDELLRVIDNRYGKQLCECNSC